MEIMNYFDRQMNSLAESDNSGRGDHGHGFFKAHQSLANFQGPITSGTDAQALKGIGPAIGAEVQAEINRLEREL